MADHPHVSDPDDIEEHHSPGGLMKYLAVFVALLVLTGISFYVGNSATLRANAPEVMWAMMMAVSCAKALLVILFFMHLMWEANWKYVLTIPASMMCIFLLLMLIPDIGRRTQKYSEERWLYSAEPRERHHAAPHAEGGHGEPHGNGHEPASKH
jgi:cytochrome c oxidase subunit 4